LKEYNNNFYSEMSTYASDSAKVIVPMLLDKYSIDSVIDFGCGDGQFVEEFLRSGLKEVIGIEGDWIRNVVDWQQMPWLKIANLQNVQDFERKFDLAVCLEVAEHLESTYAVNLIESLTNASDLVLFSAAIPGQGGTNHINLKYPDYWAELFFQRGFTLAWDPRTILWKNRLVAPWYKQNCLVFAKSTSNAFQKIEPVVFRHPEIFPELQSNLYRARKLLKKILIKTYRNLKEFTKYHGK
jgi:cyclopropane fatty-acyl-phospholipid synthase-like methyltransferase